jgi:arabinogalactan oligomer/maltooligosaccharide transport system substrate-binding protein
MKLRRPIASLLTVALVAALAALGGSFTSADAARHRGITITIWDSFDAPPKGTVERNALMKVAQQWARKTGNKVVDPGYVADRENRFIQDAAAGQGPDILMERHDRLGSFVAPGLLSTVPENLLVAGRRKGYAPVALQAFTYDGDLYGLPWARETSVLFYNRALVRKPPQTWSALISQAKGLTHGDQYGFLWDATNFYYGYAFIAANGGYVFRQAKGGYNPRRLGINTAGSIAGLKFIQDLVTVHKLVPPVTNTDIMETAFTAGQAAMIIDGPWAVAKFRAKGIDFGAAALPSLSRSRPLRPFVGVQGFLVNSKSEYTKEAWDLVAYLSRNAQLPLFKAAGRVPVLKALAQKAVVKKSAVAQAVVASSNVGQATPNIPAMAVVWQPMANALSALVNGTTTPAAAAADAQKAIQAAIAQQRA